LCATGAAAVAQDAAKDWPSRFISIVRINPPGSAADNEARIWADKLSAHLGKPLVFDYKPGASGIIGATHVARAAPDGHTFLAATTSFSVTPAFEKNLPYNVVRDFAPVSLMLSNSIVLVAHTSFPAGNLTEYIAYAKANPGKILWADGGPAAMNYLSGVMLHRMIGAEATFVHYKSGGPAIFPDLMAGRVNVYPASVQNAMQLIKSGKVKPVVLMSLHRDKQLPDVMTAHEQGLTGFEQPNYFGFVAPAGTNPAIIEKFYQAIARTAKDPDVLKLEAEGNTVVVSTPAEFTRYIASQVARWTRLVEEANIKP
jgi:tripartite-type tricarboxylate transporter receptor subunit TctC